MTPAGIDPATYRFVAQHLNHRGPHSNKYDVPNIQNPTCTHRVPTLE